MKITLKTAMYISHKIRETEKDKYSDKTFRIKEALAKYISKLTDDEWLELKKQFERPQAY